MDRGKVSSGIIWCGQKQWEPVGSSPNPKGPGYMDKARLRGLDYISAINYFWPHPVSSGEKECDRALGRDYGSGAAENTWGTNSSLIY